MISFIIYLILAIIFIVAFIILWGMNLYNQMITYRDRVAIEWGSMETLLKQRRDLIPNLIDLIERFLKNEELLSKTKKLRDDYARITQTGRLYPEKEFSLVLDQFFREAEQHPEMLSDESFKDFKNKLAILDQKIQAERDKYNKCVKTLNTLIETFPSKLVADAVHFPKAAYFELENESIAH